MRLYARLLLRWRQLFPQNPPIGGWISLGQRRLYILPTRLGLAFVMLLAFMFAGAVNYNLSLGYGMLFWLASIMLVSALHANLNLAGLRFSGSLAQAAFAGDKIHVQVHVQQDKRRLRPTLRVYQGDSTLDFEAENSDLTLDLALPTQRRGWFVPGRLTLETRYPLGLFRCWAHLDFDARGLVYPAPDPHAPPLHIDLHNPHDGQRWVAGGDEFSGLREWRQGDAPRLIAWRQSARNDRLLSRVFQSQQGDTLWLDWDSLPGALGTEGRLSRLCRWLLDAESGGLLYGLRLPGVEIAPGNGLQHRERCLAALALH